MLSLIKLADFLSLCACNDGVISHLTHIASGNSTIYLLLIQEQHLSEAHGDNTTSRQEVTSSWHSRLWQGQVCPEDSTGQ